jgi:hypothetical protein
LTGPAPSLLDTLDEGVPEGLGMLADASAVARLRATARLIPATLTDCIYLELPLNARAERLDLIVRVGPVGRSWLTQPVHEDHRRSRELQCVAGLEALIRQWAASASWGNDLAALWLEFDLPSQLLAPALPAPRLFCDYSLGEEERPLSLARAVAPLRHAVIGRPPSELTEVLRRSFDGLPCGASVASLGLPNLGRWDPLRVCVAGMPVVDLAGYLRNVGWKGNARGVTDRHLRVVRCFGTRVTHLSLLHFDVSARQVTTGIGIEYALHHTAYKAGLSDALLSTLIKAGVCSPSTAARLTRWPAQRTCRLSHLLWPSLVRRRINHVKIVYDGDGEMVQAKAYLRFAHVACVQVGARPPDPAPGFYRPS